MHGPPTESLDFGGFCVNCWLVFVCVEVLGVFWTSEAWTQADPSFQGVGIPRSAGKCADIRSQRLLVGLWIQADPSFQGVGIPRSAGKSADIMSQRFLESVFKQYLATSPVRPIRRPRIRNEEPYNNMLLLQVHNITL